MHEREQKESSTFLRWIQAFFALNIGNCHLKKNYKKKLVLPFIFWKKNILF